MAMDYKKEFFDREYTAWEAYSRVWKYARRYKFRIFVGLVSGMLTAGTMLPMLQVIQPALEKVSQNERLQTLREEFADREQGTGNRQRMSRSNNRTIEQFPVLLLSVNLPANPSSPPGTRRSRRSRGNWASSFRTRVGRWAVRCC